MTSFVSNALIDCVACKNSVITAMYDKLMPSDSSAKIRILEIGVESGASIRAWCDAFPNAAVYGIDIEAGCRAKDVGRATIFIGDVSDSTFVHNVMRGLDYFDFIIDDGSHKARDQQRAFGDLFGRLLPGGTYVIEDLHVARDADRISYGYPCTLDFISDLPYDVEMIEDEGRPFIAIIRKGVTV